MRRCSARHAPAQRRSRPRARAPRASVCGWGCAHLAGAPAALAVAGAPAAAASDRAPRRATQRCGAGGAGGGSSSGDGETRTKDLREQLAELKEQRASQAEPRAPLKRSSYRAPKAHSRTQRSRADDDTSDSRRSRGAEPSAGRVEVLVDGYNVCMSWPRLKRQMAKGELREAREELLRELSRYAAYYGVAVTAVFDAAGSAEEQRVSAMPGTMYAGVDVVFPSTARSDSADSWIEKRAVEIVKQSGSKGNDSVRVVVVTNDNQVKDAVRGAGGGAWSAAQLRADVRAADEAAEEAAMRNTEVVTTPRGAPKGSMLSSPARQMASLQYGLDFDELFTLTDEAATARQQKAARTEASKARFSKRLFRKKDRPETEEDSDSGSSDDSGGSSSEDGDGPPRRPRRKFRFKS